MGDPLGSDAAQTDGTENVRFPPFATLVPASTFDPLRALATI